MKKIISILAIVALMAAILVTSVFATEAPQLVVESKTAAAGEEIVLNVSIVNNPGISNGKIDVTFDADALEIVEIDTYSGLLMRAMCMTNGAAMNFVAVQDIKGDGILFSVKLKVKDTAAGDYQVGILVDYIDSDTQKGIAFEVVSGTVSIPAAEHVHNLVHVEAVEPGCHMEGNIEHWYCTECETVWSDEALTQITNHKSVILPATGGEVVNVEAVEPGCHMEGNIEYWICYECEKVWQDEALTQLTNIKNVILPATGGEVVHVEAKAATCFEEGNIEHWYCETCEKVWQDEALTQLTNHMNVKLAALEHTLVHVAAVEPGCHMEGNIEHWYCTVCEQVWQDEALTQLTNHKNVILPATGGEVVHMEAVEPGCHFTGNIEHWYCNECEQVWQDEALTQLTNHMNVILPAIGGEVIHVEAKEATCEENGNIEHWYCETCEQVWQDEALTQLTNHLNVIIGGGHDLVHVEAVEPGCHFTGNIEHWYCNKCETVWADEALTQVTNHLNVIVPALGGAVVHVEAKAPTCTENGNIEHWYCEECEQVWQDEALTQLTNHQNVKIGATGHNYVDGVCQNCNHNVNDVPDTGDMSAIVFALVAVSGMGLVALTKKKED